MGKQENGTKNMDQKENMVKNKSEEKDLKAIWVSLNRDKADLVTIGWICLDCA